MSRPLLWPFSASDASHFRPRRPLFALTAQLGEEQGPLRHLHDGRHDGFGIGAFLPKDGKNRDWNPVGGFYRLGRILLDFPGFPAFFGIESPSETMKLRPFGW